MITTFRGGLHVREHKNTAGVAIQLMPQPDKVSIPLSQHIGAHCRPTVKKGDRVLRGQIIGEADEGALACPVHASITGTVTGITERYDANGTKIENIIIENDRSGEEAPPMTPFTDPITEIPPEDIIERVRLAGISGMGGATFPTYAKIKSGIGKAKHVIINCAECEPFITANHRLLLERPAHVINGVKILLRTLGVRKGIIAVEDNKADAIELLESLTENDDLIEIRSLKTKYPQGDERQLIYALFRRELKPGQLPADTGCVIFNAETCAAVFDACANGKPLTERIVTVDGDCVKNPGNLLVPLGTSYRDVIECCGGLIKTPEKLVAGGPMMGPAQWDIDAPVTKGTSALLLLSNKFEDRGSYTQPPVCIHCGRCGEVCPMHLMPNYLVMFAQAEDYSSCEEYGIRSCVECGSCSYTCPGYVPLIQYLRTAKKKCTELQRNKK